MFYVVNCNNNQGGVLDDDYGDIEVCGEHSLSLTHALVKAVCMCTHTHRHTHKHTKHFFFKCA